MERQMFEIDTSTSRSSGVGESTKLYPEVGVIETEVQGPRRDAISKKFFGELTSTERSVFLRVVSKLPLSIQLLIHREMERTQASPMLLVLTSREREVLLLVANGYSRNDIASSLGISPNTAARHISNIYGKHGISTIAEATVCAITSGLVELKVE